MKKRYVLIAGAVLAVSLLGGTAAVASASAPPDPVWSGPVTACAAMHDTPAMEQMHAHMPPALQARCDAMHAQMHAGMMASSGMMA